jgi:hypothetical protein
MLAGATRFIIEFIRVNTRVLGPLTVAHVLSFMLIASALSSCIERVARGILSHSIAPSFAASPAEAGHHYVRMKPAIACHVGSITNR